MRVCFCYCSYIPSQSDDVLQYLQNYAEHFDLLKHIHFNTTVIEVTKAVDFKETGKWNVCTQSQGEQPKTEVSFDNYIYYLFTYGYLWILMGTQALKRRLSSGER